MQRPNLDVVAGRSVDSEQPPSNNTPSDKQVLMQRQLALLLHAENCRRSESQGIPTNCAIRHCAIMREILAHIPSCQLNDGCGVTFCRSSKLILHHFHHCVDPLCGVCVTVRKSSAGMKVKTLINSNHSSLNLSDYHNGPLNDCKTDMSLLNGVRGSASSSPSFIPSSSQPCTSSSLVVNGGDASRITNRNNFHLNDQQREIAIKKFVQVFLSILPTTNSPACNDPFMRQFLDQVKRIERDTFMKSKSAEEYCAQLTKCHQNLLVEFEEKRRLRANRLSDPANYDASATSINSTNSCESFGSAFAQSERENCETTTAPNFAVSTAIATSTTSTCDGGKPDQKPDMMKLEPKQEPLTSVIKVENHPENEELKIEEPQQLSSDHVSKIDESSTPSATVENKLSQDECPPSQPPVGSGNQPTKYSEDAVLQPSREPSTRVTWYPNELLRHFMPVVEKISKEKDAEPFLQPVDWEALEIFDYPKVVSHPMDLSTIRKKLEERQYKEPWDIVDDFWLMFNNAWLYNKKTSKVYKTCTRLAEIFEAQIDPVLQQLGFCCGREYYYLPPPLTCSTPKFCTIHRDSVYYVYQNEDNKPGLLGQKYMVCERCYNEAGDEVRLEIESSILVNVQKSVMEKYKNDHKEKEPFVYCKKCGRKWHRVCAIHSDDVWSDGFVCSRCLKDHVIKRPENRFTARRLPSCQLSNFLEKRVNDFLKKKDVNTGEVIVRVLASADKSVEVKPGMKARFCESGEMPESFPYRVKAIFAFQEIEGQEVCFFGLHVQEYGSECLDPNKRRVYLAYLDSVYFFRPKQYRTDIYHELLVGYIHYAKLLGYVFAHIWACPPSEGDDYIFHMHPPDQKIPKPKRLQEWYQKMLKKALLERIVVDYKDICQDAYDSRLVSPAELAYFEGDFWPNTLEELFKEIDEEDARRKREQQAMAQDNDEDDDSKENVETRGEHDKASGKKKAKKRKLKRNSSMSVTGKRKRLGGGSGDLASELVKKLYETMEKHKENFFVIRLHPQNNVASLKPIRDPDPLISSDLMECRGAFLERAREKHLEFSSLRRAKYSTLVMVYDLHNENRQPPMYTCNECSVQLETPWHCRQCGEYDLCPRCYTTIKHPHPMVQIGLSSDDARCSHDPDSDAANVQESGRDKISRLVKALGHGCSCRDANCRVYGCKVLKYKVHHFREHVAAANRNQCAKCRSLSFLSYYHSKTCHDLKCPVPLCPKLKAKMKQQQKQQRLEQTQMLRRRMATMQRYNTMTPSHQPTPPSQPSVNPPSATISESASSPVLTTIGSSSPYAVVTNSITTPSFTAQPSPLSRTNSLSSQQASYYPTAAGPSPRQMATSSTTIPSSSLTSPQHATTHLSTSPYSCANQQLLYGYMDPQEVVANNTCSSHIPYQTFTKSQSAIVQPGPSLSQPRFPQIERSHSAQFNLTPNPMRHSPGSSSCQQFGGIVSATSPISLSQPHQVYTASATGVGPMSSAPTDNFVQQQNMALPRSTSEGQQSPFSKHARHPQSLMLGSVSDISSFPTNAVSFQSGMNNSNWRSPSASIPTTLTTNNPYGNPCTQNRPPDSTFTRSVPISAPASRSCLSPPGGGITVEDVQLVQQTYNQVRHRGASLPEFFNWLNANPNLQRAWQYLQQPRMCNPQQPQSSVQVHPNLMPQSQPSASYTITHPNNPGRGTNSRYLTSTQASIVSNQPSQQQQQWAAVQMQQYPRFRSNTAPQQQQQSAYYTPNKLGNPGCSSTAMPPTPRHMNQINTVGIHPSQLPTNSSMLLPGGGLGPVVPMGRGGPSGFTQQNSQQQQHLRAGAPSTIGNMVPGPTNTSMRSTPPPSQQPQYSPIMLSQLLGPTQPGGCVQMSPSQFPPNINQTGSSNSSNRGNVDFPPTALSSHYPDGGLV